LSRRIWRPWFLSSKPMRCVVPGKKTLSASRTRTRPAEARGWRSPTRTAAAPPSPKSAVDTTFVAERSQRWKVRLENSRARRRAARSGCAAR
jgi:hypothetical protein